MATLAHEARRIALAKLLAAAAMGLTEDATGARLPPGLWQQALAKADAVFLLAARWRP